MIGETQVNTALRNRDTQIGQNALKKVCRMKSAHQIRLAGPWELRSLRDGQSAGKTALPLRVDGQTGCVAIRSFHSPTGLTSESQLRIMLTIRQEGPGSCRVTLNGTAMEAHVEESGDGLFLYSLEVTSQIRNFNELEVSLEAAGSPGTGIRLESAILEIRD